jgi:hypothetical protein
MPDGFAMREPATLSPFRLVARSLRYYAWTNLAVVLGVVAAAAALSGALLVGDSMRASLRAQALARLENVGRAIFAQHFFPADLARRLDASAPTCAAILLDVSAENPQNGARVNRVQLFGVADDYWRVQGSSTPAALAADARAVVVNRALADELGLASGADVVFRLGRPSAVPTETLLGRRDELALTLRLPAQRAADDQRGLEFSPEPRQEPPRSAFVPLAVLQRALDRADRANVILVATDARAGSAASLASALTLADLDLRIRNAPDLGYLALESGALLIAPPFETAAVAAAEALDLEPGRVLVYLANSIRIGDHSIPYSPVAAIDPLVQRRTGLTDATGGAPLTEGQLVLNDWAATALAAQPGVSVLLEYFLTQPDGALLTTTSRFTFAARVPLAGPFADRGFTPEYRGITDVRRVSDWDPPFPMDLERIRPRDEEYWGAHRATPKAFLALDHGQRLWATDGDRFGRVTSVRAYPDAGAAATQPELSALAAAWERELLRRLSPAQAGFVDQPLRETALAAAQGNTEFGGLFIGFSFFLIAAAVMLAAMLFRLGVERRSAEVGLLGALGLPPRLRTSLFLYEGAALALAGTLLGQLGAVAYAALMLGGLRTWWSAAVNAPFLRLAVTPASLALGSAITLAAVLLAIRFALRGLNRTSIRALLAGATDFTLIGAVRRRPRSALIVSITAALAALALLIAGTQRSVSPALAFWSSGALLLVAGVAALRTLLSRQSRSTKPISPAARLPLLRLAWRSAGRRPTRSILTAALVASATFVIASLEAFRLAPDADLSDRNSGSGGYALLAEAAVPLPYALSTPAGRRALSIPASDETSLAACEITPYRLRPGDESSCLNLYRAGRPRILGASPAAIARGGFRFAAAASHDAATRANPWLLLEQSLPDGAIPVIGDEAAVRWQLHRDVGQDLLITDDRGRDVRLRFVALLQSSILQSELVVSEANFTRLFPAATGAAFFLVASASAAPESVAQTLERGLAPYGLDVTRAADRLERYFAVQNTYLSTFQALGGLGLVLGTLGLLAVTARNVWERRSELGLLRAIGFRPRQIGTIVVGEGLLLVVAGLLTGLGAALVAIAPQIAARGAALPWASFAAITLVVLLTGFLAGLAALRPAVRGPIITALRAG